VLLEGIQSQSSSSFLSFLEFKELEAFIDKEEWVSEGTEHSTTCFSARLSRKIFIHMNTCTSKWKLGMNDTW
jgi:hypothetical protein